MNSCTSIFKLENIGTYFWPSVRVVEAGSFKLFDRKKKESSTLASISDEVSWISESHSVLLGVSYRHTRQPKHLAPVFDVQRLPDLVLNWCKPRSPGWRSCVWHTTQPRLLPHVGLCRSLCATLGGADALIVSFCRMGFGVRLQLVPLMQMLKGTLSICTRCWGMWQNVRIWRPGDASGLALHTQTHTCKHAHTELMCASSCPWLLVSNSKSWCWHTRPWGDLQSLLSGNHPAKPASQCLVSCHYRPLLLSFLCAGKVSTQHGLNCSLPWLSNEAMTLTTQNSSQSASSTTRWKLSSRVSCIARVQLMIIPFLCSV